MITDIVSNIYNNIIKFITGDNVQQRLLNLESSVPNILSDKDAANGYVGLDANGQMSQSYVTQTVTKSFMDTLVATSGVVANKTYRITGAATTRSLLVRGATTTTLYPFATDTATGETGVYNLSTDKFIPGGIVSFKKSLSNANLLAGGEFDITELPAPGAGYAWEYLSGSVKSTGMGTAFDGTPTITLITEGSRSQFTDDGNFLSVGTDYFATLERTTIVGNLGNSIIENTKGQVSIDAASAVGDGSIVIYGTARLITL